ncbi:hypothetical protein SLOPH_1078 [Spraguea lophii 42_110]|uniref:Uncharacterized protein n=1 Tax=Spraguea lophii (strain 42_110) TaxID=1358809 RepID=S7W6Z9_SPRLO|nr:hypothetical protein SLOPH_1078 [Spraguea lophii 42_110]
MVRFGFYSYVITGVVGLGLTVGIGLLVYKYNKSIGNENIKKSIRNKNKNNGYAIGKSVFDSERNSLQKLKNKEDYTHEENNTDDKKELNMSSDVWDEDYEFLDKNKNVHDCPEENFINDALNNLVRLDNEVDAIWSSKSNKNKTLENRLSEQQNFEETNSFLHDIEKEIIEKKKEVHQKVKNLNKNVVIESRKNKNNVANMYFKKIEPMAKRRDSIPENDNLSIFFNRKGKGENIDKLKENFNKGRSSNKAVVDIRSNKKENIAHVEKRKPKERNKMLNVSNMDSIVDNKRQISEVNCIIPNDIVRKQRIRFLKNEQKRCLNDGHPKCVKENGKNFNPKQFIPSNAIKERMNTPPDHDQVSLGNPMAFRENSVHGNTNVKGVIPKNHMSFYTNCVKESSEKDRLVKNGQKGKFDNNEINTEGNVDVGNGSSNIATATKKDMVKMPLKAQPNIVIDMPQDDEIDNEGLNTVQSLCVNDGQFQNGYTSLENETNNCLKIKENLLSENIKSKNQLKDGVKFYNLPSVTNNTNKQIINVDNNITHEDVSEGIPVDLGFKHKRNIESKNLKLNDKPDDFIGLEINSNGAEAIPLPPPLPIFQKTPPRIRIKKKSRKIKDKDNLRNHENTTNDKSGHIRLARNRISTTLLQSAEFQELLEKQREQLDDNQHNKLKNAFIESGDDGKKTTEISKFSNNQKTISENNGQKIETNPTKKVSVKMNDGVQCIDENSDVKEKVRDSVTSYRSIAISRKAQTDIQYSQNNDRNSDTEEINSNSVSTGVTIKEANNITRKHGKNSQNFPMQSISSLDAEDGFSNKKVVTENDYREVLSRNNKVYGLHMTKEYREYDKNTPETCNNHELEFVSDDDFDDNDRLYTYINPNAYKLVRSPSIDCNLIYDTESNVDIHNQLKEATINDLDDDCILESLPLPTINEEDDSTSFRAETQEHEGEGYFVRNVDEELSEILENSLERENDYSGSETCSEQDQNVCYNINDGNNELYLDEDKLNNKAVLLEHTHLLSEI